MSLHLRQHLAGRVVDGAAIGFQRQHLARGQFDEFPSCATPRQLNPAEALDVALLAEVDALQAAGIHDRRRIPAVSRQILMAVDMPQCNIVPDRVGQGRKFGDHIPSQHHAPLAAPDGAGHAEVPGEQSRRIGGGQIISLPPERTKLPLQRSLQRVVLFGDRHSAGIGIRQQPRANRIGRGADDDSAPLAFESPNFIIPRHPNPGHIERLEDFNCARLRYVHRRIVIADEQDCRRKLGKLADAGGEFTLVGRVGAAAAEGVAGEYHQVDIALVRKIDHIVHARQKVEGAAADAGFGVGLPVVLHANMHIGEVQNADRLAHHLLTSAPA